MRKFPSEVLKLNLSSKEYEEMFLIEQIEADMQEDEKRRLEESKNIW